MKSFLFYAPIALVFGSCMGSFDKAPVCQARLPLTPGKVHYYVIREDSQTFSEEKGVKVSRENNTALSLHCTAIPNGSEAHLKIIVDTLALHQHSDDRSLDMDAASAIQSPDPGERMLAAFEGAELSGEMDGKGQIALSGLEKVYRQMNVLGESNETSRMAWERRLDTAFFTSLLEKAWHIYPNGLAVGNKGGPTEDKAGGPATGNTPALAIGDSWVLPDSLNADCHIPVDTTYTLASYRNGILHFTTRAVVDIQSRRLQQTTHDGQLTLKGKQVGYIDVDAATGMVLGGKSTLMARGALKTGETSIPLIIDSTYTVSAS